MKKVKKGVWYVVIAITMVFSAQAIMAQTAPELKILSPKMGEEIPFGSDVVVAISIYDPDGDADITTVEFEVDGVDITQEARLSVFLATFPIKDTTAAGRHTVSFLIKDRGGNVAELDSFFNISPEPKRKRAVTANGSIRAGGEYDKEASQSLVGNLNVNVYGHLSNTLDYSLAVDLTNEESSDKQRVSTYRLDLYSFIGGVVIGDTTPSFSTYTIDGTQVFGVHLLPQLGAFGAELVYGRTLKDVKDPATFRQILYGGRLKIGNEKRMLWGLSWLKVKDDIDSLSTDLIEAETTPLPRENMVLGTDFSISLLDGGLKFMFEANESILSRDIKTGASSDYENVDWLFTANNSTTVPGFSSLAAKFGVMIGPFYNNTFNAEYSYIGPGYYSIANSSITNDRTGGRMWDSIWLLNDKLFLSLGFQYYWNNLKDTLIDTTKTAGYSGSAYVYPNDYLSINAGLDLQTVTDDDTLDTSNTTITGGVTQELDILITNSSLYFDGSASFFRDKVTAVYDENTYSTRFGAISYFTGFPLDTKIVFGYDFGDTPNSIYLQGKSGYRLLKNENLYPYVDVVYETGPKRLDLQIGVDYEAPWDLTFEGEFEYISSPKDYLISAFATKEF